MNVTHAQKLQRRRRPLRWLIALAFIVTAVSWALRYAGVTPDTGILPSVLFAAALVLVLLHLIDEGDKRY